MTILMAANAAMSTPAGTPEYALACDLCIIRGLDPHAYPVGDVIRNIPTQAGIML